MMVHLKRFITHLVTVLDRKTEPLPVRNHNQTDWLRTSLANANLTGLEAYALEELETLWINTFLNTETNRFMIPYSAPSSEIFKVCYAHILRGIGYFQVIEFEADEETIKSISKDGIILENNDTFAKLLEGDIHSILAKTLWSLVEADEEVKPYVEYVRLSVGKCVVKFRFTEIEMQYLQGIYKSLPFEERGSEGATSRLSRDLYDFSGNN